MAAESAGLQVEGICKRFGRLSVLRGVALAAPRGRVTALLGPNGAGKSTLFQILMGLTSCDQGRATMDGRDLLALPLHRKAQAGLGYLPQESASFPELTARENLLALLEILPMDRGQREARLGWLVSRMGLTEFLDREAGKLSGGEQKRLEIAKALAGQPRVLLLDEPFSGLDPRIIEELVQILQGLAAEGIGILLTDHNVHMTLEFVHYAYLLAEGTILCEGAPRQIAANPDARRLYLGDRFRVEEA